MIRELVRVGFTVAPVVVYSGIEFSVTVVVVIAVVVGAVVGAVELADGRIVVAT